MIRPGGFFPLDAVHAAVQSAGQVTPAEVVRPTVRHAKEEDLSRGDPDGVGPQT